MRSKKLHLALVVLSTISLSTIAKAQLYINNAQFFIQSNATVTVQGTLTSNTSILGAGTVIMNGSTNQSLDMGGNTIPKLQINNGANVTLASSVQVDTTLSFVAGKLVLGNFNLTIGSSTTAAITGASTSAFVVTNGTGVVTKNALAATPFIFAVGDSTGSAAYYFPLTISNAGTSDNYSVSCSPHVYTAGTTGTADTKEVVDASWKVGEAVAGGSNLSVTAQWASTNELTGFNRAKGGIGYYIPTAGATLGWDLLNTQTGAATGGNPYTYTRTAVTAVGTFAVGTRPVESPLLITPTVFLEGPYNSGTGLMANTLGQKNLIPTTEPYTGMTGFTHSGSGGGETTIASVLTNTGASSDIVDWVFVQLHRASDSVVVSTRAVLIRRDGQLAETDGSVGINMCGNAAGTYFISVRHRNHLGVRIAGTITLAKTVTTSYNFSTSVTQAYAKGITNTPMSNISGVYVMWGGDATNDAIARMTGPLASNDYLKIVNTLGNTSTILSNVYLTQDLNMDGILRVTGPLASNDYLKLVNMIGSTAAIIKQPTF